MDYWVSTGISSLHCSDQHDSAPSRCWRGSEFQSFCDQNGFGGSGSYRAICNVRSCWVRMAGVVGLLDALVLW
eukprot:3528269-Amphidinium_carterae.1